ncbi:protein SMAX1-LIKE 6 [Corylus avellana]|uniref:protein SMAX1-LIKE 6 n=1 Tax=Corylus avellana TaxID=13451 RepID=UPI00286B335C|nr:protein SMAX1-LIKE 6 [Corylus avellana]
MPTPVSAARQCLTEEAARALDDAVAVARRRSHAQTTSLHAVSALLGLPSSTLREACARARCSAYSPRLQFRALELSVGVSLDRLPSSSRSLDEPPVSNSLMAAIKRSQANQRRHPESFHLHHQILQNNPQQTTSLLKVELKHFILSILDDPIVSRVLGEAGFRSCDIKLAIIHPPMVSRFPRNRCPPVFLCNLTDSDPLRRSFGLEVSGDENSRRIAQVLLRKSGKNPVLVGVYAVDALRSFVECVNKGGGSALPNELSGLSVICVESEISEFVKGSGSEEKMGLRFKELGEQCLGPGIVVSLGDLKALSEDGAFGEAVSFVVSQLTRLVELHGEKLWLMGAAGTDETYLKLLGRFPSIEKDWDLHPLTITSSKPSSDGFCSKSSLLGSFVPLGGFFSTPSDFKYPFSSTRQPFSRCKLCTEKYEQDVAVIQKGGSTISVADQHSESIPSWLRMAELDTGEGVNVAKTKDDETMLNAKILGLQKKWNDICQHLHQVQQFPKLDISHAWSQVPSAEGFPFGSAHTSPNGSQCADPSHRTPTDLKKPVPLNQNIQLPVDSDAENANIQSKLLGKVSRSRQIEMEHPWLSTNSMPNVSPPPDHTSSSSVTSVTTDLGLGTLYASTSQEPDSPKLPGRKECLQHFSGSISNEVDAVSENTSRRIAHSSSCSGANMGGQSDPRDFKSLRRFLTEKVCWQDEAICSISEVVSCCRSGNGRRGGSSLKGHIWLTFLGPDKVGKRRIASALAEIMFGSLICADFGSQDRVCQSNSMFGHQELDGYDVKFRAKTVVDYIAGELSKKPHSVVFLQNVDKADPLAQTRLSQAIKTGKLADSHGREISINNTIFVITSTITKGNRTVLPSKEPVEFSEERILKAKRYQMQILIERVTGDGSRSNGMNVRVTIKNGTPNAGSVNKRKLIETCDSEGDMETFWAQKRAQKVSRSYLDLNLPVEEEEVEENINYGDCDSDSISENSEAWLEELFDQVDEKVVFKPFDFDAHAGKIMKDISLQFQRTFGSEVMLEIDYKVMVQILAAAWLSEKNRTVEEWVEQVLCRSFAEAQQKYHPSAQSVVKLVTCEGSFLEDHSSGVCLPARINLK